ncbi:septum site-determining protein MinC [Roseibium sp. CAU 1637]|uniref:Probable septum site-determining protein MinC n=1 Tax=Roseibium limicola TaxID=2816037 RepID=A0A939J8I9_9HYPH|nr:septum site-determining protein MinC [Roseibium limicola]MBO0345366.1 septum site-determining protein MinC [Roseibium limicola]
MKFKGKSFIAIVLTPQIPSDAWFAEIDRIMTRSPGFFIDRPIILDARGTKMPIDDLEGVLEGLSQRSIRVMGIDGIAGTRLKPGMPPSFGGGRLAAEVDVPGPAGVGVSAVEVTEKASKGEDADADSDATVDLDDDPANDQTSIVITEPVRSGQSVVHPTGDVTIIGSVSSGAEVIAGGSIHVYGALRGRALAGVSGNEDARIFCTKLDAELVSINGLYQIADDFGKEVLNASAQIRFENETLVFERLG